MKTKDGAEGASYTGRSRDKAAYRKMNGTAQQIAANDSSARRRRETVQPKMALNRTTIKRKVK